MNSAEITQQFKELNAYLDALAKNPKDAGHTWIAFTDKFYNFEKEVVETVQFFETNIEQLNNIKSGWECPDSPNGECDYSGPDEEDSCIYCGQPEERK